MSVNATWLGQSGLVLEAGGRVLAVDPWLSPHEARALPPAMPAHWPAEIDTVLITHGHGDHLDLPGLVWLAARSRLGRFVAPGPHVPAIRDRFPAAPIASVRPGDTLPGEVPIQVMPAWHGITVADGYGPAIAADGSAPHVGYALMLGGLSLYVAGDTISDPELVALVAALAPDVVFLPVNGRDAEREARGILGNMTPAEAFSFAESVGAGVLVPLHHDGVTGNTCDAGAIAHAATSSRVHLVLPARGRPFNLGRSVS